MYLDHQVNNKEVQKRLGTVHPSDPVKVSVKCSARDDWIRFVTCWEITEDDIRLAIEKIVYVIKEYDGKIRNQTKTNTVSLNRQMRSKL